MDERISWWFQGLEAGLETLPEDAPFFRACAGNCLARGTLDAYRKLIPAGRQTRFLPR